jgi:hypothetical protein
MIYICKPLTLDGIYVNYKEGNNIINIIKYEQGEVKTENKFRYNDLKTAMQYAHLLDVKHDSE